MIFARNNIRSPRLPFRLNNRIRPMPTNIMKSPNCPRSIFYNKIAVSGHIKLHIITRLCEAGTVGHYHPFLGEDCAALQGVQRLGAIPGGWEGFSLGFFLDRGACGLCGEGEKAVHFGAGGEGMDIDTGLGFGFDDGLCLRDIGYRVWLIWVCGTGFQGLIYCVSFLGFLLYWFSYHCYLVLVLMRGWWRIRTASGRSWSWLGLGFWAWLGGVRS